MNEERTRAALRQLEALKRDYRSNTRTLLETLSVRVAEERDPDLLGEVESQLHKLAGSGGSFGFPDLSREARALELSVRRQREDDPDDFHAGDLAQRIGGLVRHLGHRADDPPPNPSLREGSPPPLGTILLVDRDSQDAERLTTTLLQFGHSVRTVATAEAVDTAVTEQTPEALLVDLDCAGEEETASAGILERIGQLRERGALREGAVMYFSRRDTLPLRLAAARAGAAGFFVKPIDAMQVIDRLELIRQRHQAPRYRIMLIDDDRLLARHHAAVLEAGGFEVEVVAEPFQALERMTQFRPDLLLLDMYMPGCSGPELARVIRMHDEWLATPIVFLSAETDMDLQLTAASEGADDFLTKPIPDAHLVAAVRTRCDRAHQMASLINRDSLTGLLKHARIKEELIAEVARAQRSRQPLCVAMLDMDHFKRVNDQFGHPAGDQVIRGLANLLRQRVRQSDRVGRYGGEEFMLVLPNCDETHGLALLEDVRERFKRLLFRAGGEEFTVTLSAGLASFPRLASAGELLTGADQALYAAKRGGRDRVAVAAG